jgi:hypothetical protein
MFFLLVQYFQYSRKLASLERSKELTLQMIPAMNTNRKQQHQTIHIKTLKHCACVRTSLNR